MRETVHAETHRGYRISIERVPADQWNESYLRDKLTGYRTSHERNGGVPGGDLDALLKKVRAKCDVWAEDAAMLADLTALIRNSPDNEHAYPLSNPQVGDVAYVWAMGRLRRGRIIKVTSARATIAYTTASSNGRVFRKNVSHDMVRTVPTT